MRIYKASDYNDLSRKAANIISAQIIMKPNAVLGLAPEDEQSYSHFMHVNFFDHINIKPENTNIPNGLEPDEAALSKILMEHDILPGGHLR